MFRAASTLIFWLFFVITGWVMQLILSFKLRGVDDELQRQRSAQEFRLRWSALIMRLFFGVPTLDELRNQASHLPDQFVLISNHRSNLDPLLVSVIGRPLVFLSKKAVLKSPVVGQWMRLCGDISVDRGEKSSRGQSLNDMRERLERGDSLLIFPEGTRQTDPNQPLGDFRDGAFNLASQTGIPIVALVMKDTGSIWKKGSFLLDIQPLKYAISEPIAATNRQAQELKEHCIQTMRTMIQTLSVEQ